MQNYHFRALVILHLRWINFIILKILILTLFCFQPPYDQKPPVSFILNKRFVCSFVTNLLYFIMKRLTIIWQVIRSVCSMDFVRVVRLDVGWVPSGYMQVRDGVNFHWKSRNSFSDTQLHSPHASLHQVNYIHSQYSYLQWLRLVREGRSDNFLN